MEAELILGLITILVRDGIPALVNIMSAWQKVDPNLEDINKLHDLVKRPEEY